MGTTLDETGKAKKKIPTPVKAIRLKCLDCCGGSPGEVRQCPVTDCSLYYYRLGHRPKKNSDLTDEIRSEIDLEDGMNEITPEDC